MKKFLSLILAVLMITGTIPSVFAESTSSDTENTSLGADVDTSFKIIAGNLPYYLGNEVIDNYISHGYGMASDVLSQYSDSEIMWLSFAESFANGSSIILNELFSGMGGLTLKEEKLLDTTKALVQSVQNNPDLVSSCWQEIKSGYSGFTGIYKNTTSGTKLALAQSLSKSSKAKLSSEQIEKMIDDAMSEGSFEKVGAVFDATGKVVDVVDCVVYVFQLYDLNVEIIDRLMGSIPSNSKLYEGLTLLRNEITQSPESFIWKNYLAPTIADEVFGALKSLAVSSVKSIFNVNLATPLALVNITVDLLYKYAVDVKIDDIIQLYTLYDFTATLNSAVFERRSNIYNCFVNHTSINDSVLEDYKFIWNSFVGAYKQYIRKCAACDKTGAYSKTLELVADTDLSFPVYVKCCATAIYDAVVAGQLNCDHWTEYCSAKTTNVKTYTCPICNNVRTVNVGNLTPYYTGTPSEPSTEYVNSIYYDRLCSITLSGNQIEDLIAVAESQLGYHEGNSTADLGGDNTNGSNNYTEYGYWCDGNAKHQWCAAFVVWCARQAGISRSIINYSLVASYESNYLNVPFTDRSKATPKRGDLIFFDWAEDGRDGNSDHVGIVLNNDGSNVTFIDGNSTANCVRTKTYSLTNANILGYGRPKYTTSSSVAVTGVSLNKTSSSLEVGKSVALVATIKPTNATNRNVVWASSNTNVATVSASGVVTAKTAGTTIITAKTADGGKTATCTVTVTNLQGYKTQYKYYHYTDGNGNYSVCGGMNIVLGKWTSSKREETGWLDTPLELVSSSPTSYNHTVQDYCDDYGCIEEDWVGGKYVDSNGVSWYREDTRIVGKDYTVTFDANGGSCSTNNKTVTYNSVYGALPIPTRVGYTFAGWYTAKTDGTKITSSSIVSLTANQTLYAHWTTNSYTITFACNGGTVSPTSKQVYFGSAYGDLPTPIKPGFTFKGWYTGQSGGTEVTSQTILNTAGDKTLYAQWTINAYTATWTVPAGATITVERTSSPRAGASIGVLKSGQAVYYGDVLSITYAANAGYTLSETGKTGFTVTGNVWPEHIYATVTPNTYTVTFNANGGTGAPTAQVKTHDITLTLSTTQPTRTGYAFQGWATSSTGAVEYSAGAGFEENANVTLYAVWKSNTVSVTGVTLSKTAATLTDGDTLTLTATIAPSNATNKNVTWSSSNTSVATVSTNGVVTAKAAGTATITVKTSDGSKTATCTVTVKAKTVSVTGVTLSKTAATLIEGDTLTLTATIAPSNATNKNVTWTSSNTSVATVNTSGVVTAKAAGTATITVKSADGGKIATCAVTVTKAQNDNESADMVIGIVTATAGQTVRVPITLPNNPGIAGLEFTLEFDSSALEIVAIEYGSWAGIDNLTQERPAGQLQFTFYSPLKNFTGENLIQLVFKVKDDAEICEHPINVVKSYACNLTPSDIDLSITAGAVRVLDYIIGDSNGDGKINTKDVVLIAQYIAGWDVIINTAAIDCSGDGIVNTKDVVLLAQFIAGWDVELG